MLIAAASGRALAASARRGGYVPLVADAFGDADTLTVAESHAAVDLAGRSADDEIVMHALGRLAAGRAPMGIVCGSGFEDRTELVSRIGERWPLLGNAPATVARVKDPLAFAALCRQAGVAHPETRRAPPADPKGWLVKRVGGAGGWHIREASSTDTSGEGVYFQRRVAGVPLSALVLGDGRGVMVLGFSAQWSAPLPRHPYRYGGAVRPAAIGGEVARRLADAIARLTALVPLKGLNSADFLVDGETFHLLEINPRPGATFDLFEPADGPSLFALHVAACQGALPPVPPRLDDAAASAILYAARTIDRMPALHWPDWASDRPVPGSSVKADAPLCTVLAPGPNAEAARDLLARRMAAVEALLWEPVA
ncbi:MAG TPA: ATP-grasp domain-containing protein [Pseudolabrys sp.]|nr:ATP-grasp domain-containing protein [Pseudolabrys sp.]